MEDKGMLVKRRIMVEVRVNVKAIKTCFLLVIVIFSCIMSGLSVLSCGGGGTVAACGEWGEFMDTRVSLNSRVAHELEAPLKTTL